MILKSKKDGSVRYAVCLSWCLFVTDLRLRYVRHEETWVALTDMILFLAARPWAAASSELRGTNKLNLFANKLNLFVSKKVVLCFSYVSIMFIIKFVIFWDHVFIEKPLKNFLKI